MRQVAKQVAIISEGTGILDLNFYNSKEFIMQTLQELGQKGRDFYLTKFFIVDFFYPITYAAFYGFTILILKFSFVYLAVVTIIILVVLVIIKRKNI